MIINLMMWISVFFCLLFLSWSNAKWMDSKNWNKKQMKLFNGHSMCCLLCVFDAVRKKNKKNISVNKAPHGHRINYIFKAVFEIVLSFFFAELSKLKCAKHGREMEKSEQKPSNKHQFDRLAFYFHFRFDKWKSPLIRQCHAHNLYLPLQSEFMTSLIMLLFGFIVTHICV